MVGNDLISNPHFVLAPKSHLTVLPPWSCPHHEREGFFPQLCWLNFGVLHKTGVASETDGKEKIKVLKEKEKLEWLHEILNKEKKKKGKRPENTNTLQDQMLRPLERKGTLNNQTNQRPISDAFLCQSVNVLPPLSKCSWTVPRGSDLQAPQRSVIPRFWGITLQLQKQATEQMQREMQIIDHGPPSNLHQCRDEMHWQHTTIC